MKLIFLDIDGVLNHIGTEEIFEGSFGIGNDCLNNLKEITDATGAKIVLTSTWRMWWEPNVEVQGDSTGRYMDKRLATRGLRIYDKANYEFGERGHGIIDYMGRSTEPVESWVVLDDEVFADYEECGIIPHLVKTSFYGHGLLEQDARRAIAMLNNGATNPTLLLPNFIKTHPDWEVILSAPPYSLRITRDGNYIMFKYTQGVSDFTIPLVREARGIIFYEPTWECVCHPFDKFGNYGEAYCPDIDWSTASVQTKIDGSLIKCWWHNCEWHVSTNGTIDAYKAELANNIKYKTFGELFEAALPPEFDWNDMNRRCTTMFELVSPYNRVVIDYPKTEVYFLGERNNVTQLERTPHDSDTPLASYCEIPEWHSLTSVEAVRAAADALPWDEEGYVVCDANFNRVKIKSPKYVEAHYARANNCINAETLIQVILDKEQAEFLVYASDYKEALEKYELAIADVKNQINKELIELRPNLFASQKEYALEVLKRPRWMQYFLFNWNKLDEAYESMTAKKWSDLLERI